MKKFGRQGFISLLLLIVSSHLLAQKPTFELKDLDNQYQSYEEIKGEKLTIIDFWATWCQPCLRSIPELIGLAEKYESLGVRVIGISIDGPRNQSKLKPFASSLGVEYTILRDVNGEAMADMNVNLVPTLMIYDREDKLIFQHEGFRPGDEKIIKQEIERLLNIVQ